MKWKAPSSWYKHQPTEVAPASSFWQYPILPNFHPYVGISHPFSPALFIVLAAVTGMRPLTQQPALFPTFKTTVMWSACVVVVTMALLATTAAMLLDLSSRLIADQHQFFSEEVQARNYHNDQWKIATRKDVINHGSKLEEQLRRLGKVSQGHGQQEENHHKKEHKGIGK